MELLINIKYTPLPIITAGIFFTCPSTNNVYIDLLHLK